MSLLNVTVEGIGNNRLIPVRYARCGADAESGHCEGANVRPSIVWSGAPPGTLSYAIIVVDSDVPARFDTANQPGRSIPSSMERRNFYHWLQADIPVGTTRISEGPGGLVKPGIGGRNDYGTGGTDQGLGYDGPCPPWNDERLHHYHFRVYALDVPSLGLKPGFSGKELESAMQGHILAQGEVVGTYTTNQHMLRAA